jgi:hypothetical protein
MKALAREREARFQTADEMADALENAARRGDVGWPAARDVAMLVRELVDGDGADRCNAPPASVVATTIVEREATRRRSGALALAGALGAVLLVGSIAAIHFGARRPAIAAATATRTELPPPATSAAASTFAASSDAVPSAAPASSSRTSTPRHGLSAPKHHAAAPRTSEAPRPPYDNPYRR